MPTEAAKSYLCSSCGHRFSLEPDADKACPACLKAEGLALLPEAASGGGRGSAGLVIALALVAIGLLTWYLLRSGAQDAPPSAADVPARTQTPKPTLSQVPTALQQRPDEVTPGVKAAADKLPDAPAEIVTAVRRAVDAGLMPGRPMLEELLDAPRPAALLAPALEGKKVGAAGTLEVTSLASALLAAKGHTVSWGYDPGERHAATDVGARRYLLKVGSGAWMPLDGRPVPDEVTPLDEAGVLANVLAWRGLSALAARDFERASETLGYAGKLAPKDPTIVFTVGQIQFANEAFDAGFATMERAAEMAGGGDGMTWYTLGIFAVQAERGFKAHKYLMKATELDKAFPDPWIAMAQLALDRYEMTPKDDQPAVLQEAQGHAAQAAKIDPQAPGLKTIQARLAAFEGDTDLAERLLREEIELHPRDAGAWNVLAQFLLMNDRTAQALEVLQEADDKGITDAELHALTGMVLANMNRLGEAVVALEKALAADPGSGELRPQLAQLHKALGDEGKARDLMVDHIERYPQDGNGRLLLAQLEIDAGRYDAAEIQLQAVLKDQPTALEPLMLRYIGQLRAGVDVSAARDAAVRAAGKRSAVAQILVEQGFPEESEAVLREALEKEPEDTLSAVILVAMLAVTGRAEEAEKIKAATLEKVVEEDRAELEAQFKVALDQAQQAIEAAKASGIEVPEPPPTPEPKPKEPTPEPAGPDSP